MEEKGYLVTEQTETNRIIYANAAACVLTGFSAEELLLTDPYKVTEELKVTKISFDSTHFLWILDASNNCRKKMTELERTTKAVEDALRADRKSVV